jgi:uncharacterized protein YutE (UPF0331/DUF86 family)
MSLEFDGFALAPKVDSIARCLLRIEQKKPFSAAELGSDFDLQDIVSTNMTRMIQLCVDLCTMILARSQAPIPGEAAQCFEAIAALGWIDAHLAARLKKAEELRNIMVHEYERIDWDIVHSVTEHHLDDIRSFVKIVVQKTRSS